MIKHIRRWNMWRKHCVNGRVYKLLVLFNITHSPTMAFTLLAEEADEIKSAFLKQLKERNK